VTQSVTKRVDVAVAVIFNRQGLVLWACRPEGKPYAGYWEFPGGKLEQGETVWQALVRELQEELGIVATQGGPWFHLEHDYPHAQVRLHFYRVWAFEGVPKSLEKQRLKWASLGAHLSNGDMLSPILPATEPLLPVLNQPLWMAVSHYGVGFEACASQFESALPLMSSPVYVQFREKTLRDQSLRSAFEHCEALCMQHGHVLLINSDGWLPLCDALGHAPAHPVHLVQKHLIERPGFLVGQQVLGASVHDSVSVALASQQGLRYAVLGSVQQTASHQGQLGMGWAAFEALVAEHARLPVYAIGGLKPFDLLKAQSHGAHGLALLSQFSRETTSYTVGI
jgi:8-oxo-dGTP diphosphatase